VDRGALLRLALESSPAVALPILILLGLRFGFATPTEMAVLSVVYSLLLSLVLYRDLSWSRFKEAMVEAGIATGVVMLVIMGSAVVGWLLTFDQVPTRFAEWVTATIQNPILVILALNVLMLLVGMPLDLPPAILLLGPIFVPLAASIGLDPVQLGLIMIINLGIGLYTPPIGTTLFISSSIARTTLADTTRELWPFFAVAMLVLLGVSYVPALTIY
jgi:tripartite ATP-independent transporter DctM subunit